jgi:hypothetical protein
VRKRAGSRPGNNHPLRYLLLTKQEPHPRQIGRIAQRVNSMGTMRLYAFKDWAAVRNVGPHLRILSQDLERIAMRWSRDRHLISRLVDLDTMRRAAREARRLQRALKGAVTERERQARVQAFAVRDLWSPEAVDRLRSSLPGSIPRKPVPWPIRVAMRVRHLHSRHRYREHLRRIESGLVADIRDAALHALSGRVEAEIAGVSLALDELAMGAAGGLRLRVDRSAHYVRELRNLMEALRITGIPTWTSYDQLAMHGLLPAADQAKRAGGGLEAAQARLLSIAETVQTSAVRGRSAASRYNAALLRRAAMWWLLILLLFVFAVSSTAGKALTSRVGEVLGRLLAAMYTWLPGWMTSSIEQISAWIHSLLP